MGVANLARAAASPLVRGRPPSSPDVVLSRTKVRAEPDRLAAYARACGFAPGPEIPPTYPHVLAFHLVMRLMTRRDFPFALPGLMHLRNSITVRRPIDAGEAMTFSVHAGAVAEHPKGRTVDVLTSATAHGELCWSQRSTYLRPANASRPASTATPARAPAPDTEQDPARTPPRPPAPDTEQDPARTTLRPPAPDTEQDPARTTLRPPAPDTEQDPARADAQSATAATMPDDIPSAAQARWDLSGSLGRRYARVSGDWNPIHLSPWTARFFGLKCPISHGMWTMARALSAMDTLPAAFTADVTFAAPIPLPSQVEFATDGARLFVRPVDAPDARLYLIGAVTPP